MKSWDRQTGENPEESDHDGWGWTEGDKEEPGKLGGRRLGRAFNKLGFRNIGCELRSGHAAGDQLQTQVKWKSGYRERAPGSTSVLLPLISVSSLNRDRILCLKAKVKIRDCESSQLGADVTAISAGSRVICIQGAKKSLRGARTVSTLESASGGSTLSGRRECGVPGDRQKYPGGLSPLPLCPPAAPPGCLVPSSY